MADIQVKINESAEVKDQAGSAPAVVRKSYRVTDKAARESTEESIGSEGIFKNGVIYKPGDTIELDETTAANYIALGEVEEVTETDPSTDNQEEATAVPAPGTVVEPEGGQNA